MKVKIFQASGFKEIAGLEETINTWLDDTFKVGQKLLGTQTALCQVGDAEKGERYQHAVVTVWYQE